MLFIINSCTTTNYTSDEKILVDFLKDESCFKTKVSIVVVPVNGCGQCTQDIIEFSKENYKNDKVLFIYSDWDRQGKAIYKGIPDFEKYVVIDKKSEFKSLGLVENKPVVFFIENNRIKEKIKFDDSISDEIIKRIQFLIK